MSEDKTIPKAVKVEAEDSVKSEKPQEIFIKDIKPMSELITADGADTDAGAFAVGDVVIGEIVSIEKGKVVVDLNNMVTGVIGGAELADSGGTVKNLKVGDEITTIVVGTENDEGQLELSLKRARQEFAWDDFMALYNSGGITKMKMKEANKGGLLVEMDGIRGFLPVSQLTPEHYPRVEGGDIARILACLESLVGQDLAVKVINIDEAERRIIVSEKAAYEDQRKQILVKLKVGEKIKGTVSGVVNFGIFVNYEGVEGLVHISEIAWGHVSDPKEYARVGDKLEVLVIGVEGDKVSFSMKRLTSDPWVEAVSKYSIGQMVKGQISRITPFGAFVRLDSEIEGLIHISELSADEHIADPSKIVKIGQEMEAQIISIEASDHRLGLSVKVLTEPGKASEEEASTSEENQDNGKSQGTPVVA